jgi:hypothetical protein
MKNQNTPTGQLFGIGYDPMDLIERMNEKFEQMEKLINEKIQPPKQTELMTKKEVAELLQKDHSTLFRWDQKKILTKTFIDGSVYYYRSDIDKILEQNKGK